MANLFDVQGNAAIGSGATYAGSSNAPTDGLIIEGNVGIGTSSPTDELDVRGNIIQQINASDVQMQVKSLDTDVTSNAGLTMIAQNGAHTGRILFNTTYDTVRIVNGSGANDSAAIDLDTDGKVGVGTSTPGAQLEVYNDSAGSASAYTGLEVDVNFGITSQSANATGLEVDIDGSASAGCTARGLSVDISGITGSPTAAYAATFQGGAVGIGTNAPSSGVEGLEISNSSDVAAKIDQDATNTALWIDCDTGGSSYKALHIQTNTGSSTIEALAVMCDGEVAIGHANPSAELDVDGDIEATSLADGAAADLEATAGGVIQRKASDRKLKKDVKAIKSALAKIMKLRGVTYKWKDQKKMGRGTQYGLIAQEVQRFIPELITKDHKGFLGVRYSNMVALLIEAMKEQESRIKALEKKTTQKKQIKSKR